MERKEAPLSCAMALATSVLPQPGGPEGLTKEPIYTFKYLFTSLLFIYQIIIYFLYLCILIYLYLCLFIYKNKVARKKNTTALPIKRFVMPMSIHSTATWHKTV
jgi:hypothetical protein